MKILKLKSNRSEGYIWIPLHEIGAFYSNSALSLAHQPSTSTIIHSRDDDFNVKETPEQIIAMIKFAMDFGDSFCVEVELNPVDGRPSSWRSN